MAANSFVIDPELLTQAKTYAKQAAEENMEFYNRMGTLIDQLSEAISGMGDALAGGIQNNRIGYQPENFSRRQKRLKENSQRAEALCEMIQTAMDQGELTENGLKDALETVRNFLMGLLGFQRSSGAAAPESQTLTAAKAVAVSSAALAGTFGLVIPSFYTSVKPILEDLSNISQNMIAQASAEATGQTGQASAGNTSPAPSNPNLTAYSNSSSNWASKAGGKVNDYSGYSVVKGFDKRFVLKQRNYYNGAVACTATSDAIVASITTGKLHEPGKSYWKGNNCTWPNTKVIPNTQNISVEKQCQIICEKLQDGDPVILRVPNHSVVAVGIRQGVEPASAKPADILIIDPGDGKVKTADEIYSGWYSDTDKLSMQDNIGWSLRVAKDSVK